MWSWSSKAATRPAKAGRSRPSPSGSARVSSAWWRCRRRPIAKRAQLYLQRYITHLPTAGEIVIFDRSWYNRAGVEYVMGFCTEEQHRRFLQVCPEFELYIVDGGIQLIKYWLEVGDEEQKRRFEARIDDPLRQWKLSPTDLCSRSRWFEYSRARDMMFEATNTKFAPWYIVRSDDKRRARLNCIRHLLDLIPYEKLPQKKAKLPERSMKDAYDDLATLNGLQFVAESCMRRGENKGGRIMSEAVRARSRASNPSPGTRPGRSKSSDG